HGAQLQQGHSRGRLREGNRRRGGLLLPLPYRPLPRGRDDAGSGAAQAPRSRRRRRTRLQLPPHPHHGSADDGARLRQDERAFAGAGRPRSPHDGGLGPRHGPARRHSAHRRPSRHEPLLGAVHMATKKNGARGKSSKVVKLKPKATAAKGKSDPKHIDHFLKTAGIDTAREKEIGQHIGYRYDVNLLPDYNRLTLFLKQYIELMGWDDLNWLEDVHMGYEEGK